MAGGRKEKGGKKKGRKEKQRKYHTRCGVGYGDTGRLTHFVKLFGSFLKL